ncbi:RIO-like serine/threonine protein kinase [Anoxybacillus calidus]|uniref:RIO-like serine/threonine protein kinase n=1 Tax=[Anoxybacillus] calidus TaxID=575178 RepID=A0A7W0BW74_9BACL|nr:RIO-like serine/threonine protein kinase [Anoxybacillus calidus]
MKETNLVNCDEMKKHVKRIKVKSVEDEDVIVNNKSSLEMIGKGRQGAVFKINDQMCMKVYGDVEDCEREYYAMSLGQHTSLIPRIYCKGKNFIVMEMVYGIDLREYLQTNPLTKELSYRLIEMLLTFKEIGYERIDHHKRQIYLQEDGSLKVIDVGRTVWRNRTYPYPRKLLRSLGKDYEAVFLQHVQELAPELYKEWQYYIDIDEAAAQMYENMKEKKDIDWRSIRKKANKLLTIKNEKKHYEQLYNLVYKVVKELKKQEQLKKNKKIVKEQEKSKKKKK